MKLNVDMKRNQSQARDPMTQEHNKTEENEHIYGFLRAADECTESPNQLEILKRENEELHTMLRNERYERMLLEGEIARMRFESIEPNSFLGFPLRCYDSSDDDCKRTTWEVKIEGRWEEVVTSALRFDKQEAVQSICQILKAKIK
jgi:hypothetical protein